MGRDATILALAHKRGVYIDRLYNLLPSQGMDLPDDLAIETRVRYEQLEERVNAMFSDGVETIQDPLTVKELRFLAEFASRAWAVAEDRERYHASWARVIDDFAAMHDEDTFVVVRSVDVTNDFDVFHGSTYTRDEGNGFVLEGYAPLSGKSWHPKGRPEYVVEAWSDDSELLASGTFTREHGLVIDGLSVKETRTRARAQLGVAGLLSSMSRLVPELPKTEDQVAKEREVFEQLSKTLQLGISGAKPEGELQVESLDKTLSQVDFNGEHIKKARELQERATESHRERWALIVALVILLCMGVAYQIVQRGGH